MDLRVQRTYRSLTDAFTRLIQEHPYENISVAMLCDEASIRRTTFYKHFSDKAAFFEFFIEQLRFDLENLADSPCANAEPVTLFQALLDFLIRHEKMMDNIFDSAMVGNMLMVMCDKIYDSILERHRAEYEAGNHAVSLEATAHFAAGGIIRLIEYWWELGHDPAEEASFVRAANVLLDRALGNTG